MIPSTVAGLLALLGCIAPGLVFQLRRERYLPGAQESVLREASRIALTSLLFTGIALSLVLWLSTQWTALPDVEQWLRLGNKYLPDNYASVSGFLVLVVVAASSSAWLGERITRGVIRGKISQQSIWWLTFRSDANRAPGSSQERVALWVTTENGTQFRGRLRHYDADPSTPAADRELALGGTSLQRLPDGSKVWESLSDYDAVIIPGSDIRHLAVQYLGPGDTPVHALPPAALQSGLLPSLRALLNSRGNGGVS
jgi:hypothetical protein